MQLLLDTHITLWAQPSSLPETARALLEEGSNELLVSTAAVWEVAIKHAKWPADMPTPANDFHDHVLVAGWRALDIDARSAILTQSLPALHGDPFDRIMIAQAITHGIGLVTHDSKIELYIQQLQTSHIVKVWATPASPPVLPALARPLYRGEHFPRFRVHLTALERHQHIRADGMQKAVLPLIPFNKPSQKNKNPANRRGSPKSFRAYKRIKPAAQPHLAGQPRRLRPWLHPSSPASLPARPRP